MSIAFMDIETTGLKPSQSYVLTTAVLRGLEESPLLVINLAGHEEELLEQVRHWLEDQERIVSWEGYIFDVPFLNQRMARYGMSPLRLRDHFDLKWWARKYNPFGLFGTNNRANHGLEAHAKFAGISAKNTPLDREVWNRAIDGDVDSLVHVAQHNVEDVITLRGLYEVLIERVPNI